jgi:hypothetical protein
MMVIILISSISSWREYFWVITGFITKNLALLIVIKLHIQLVHFSQNGTFDEYVDVYSPLLYKPPHPRLPPPYSVLRR